MSCPTYESRLRQHVAGFCSEFEYPAEACAALLECYDRVIASPAAAKVLNLVARYEADDPMDWDKALDELKELAVVAGTHVYTLHLLYFVCLARHTRQLYAYCGIPAQIYYDTMCDLKWKLFECKNVHGIWGSFVAFWFPRFFMLSRFALGRLQFETIAFEREYENAGLKLGPQSTVINLHIPSCGPLKHDACLDSYAQAAEFYKKYFENSPMAFVCHSWLLWPMHTEFLPAHSNIRPFMADFDIIHHEADPKGSDLWRLFDRECDCSTPDLPAESSLRRAYVDWLRQGKPVGEGFGVFFWRDGKVVPH